MKNTSPFRQFFSIIASTFVLFSVVEWLYRGESGRLLKNDHLRRFPCLRAGPLSLRRTAKYASLLRISGALHLVLFEQPAKNDFPSSLPEVNLLTCTH
jgi:hypothetical protein